LIEKLIENSKASQLACIEIHNKPIFPFRYEVCTILNINAWELLLKAFILKFHPEIKVIFDDGTTKPFDECLKFIASKLGKNFSTTLQNISKIYEYRCNIIHFYQDNINSLLLPLLCKNILLYNSFLVEHFKIDLAQENELILLPIGFNTPISPIDFLSNDSVISESSAAVKNFIKSIINSTEQISNEGNQDSILFSYKMSLINENRIKNADIIAAITKDTDKALFKVENTIDKFILTEHENEEGVKKVKLDEETLYDKIYTETHADVVNRCKVLFTNFKQNKEFIKIIKSLRGNPIYHKQRFLDAHKQTGTYKNYYTEKVYEELAKYFVKK